MGKQRFAALERLLKNPPAKPYRKCWFDELPPEQQAELDAFRKEWHAGAFKGQPIPGLLSFWKEEFALTVGLTGFHRWLKSTPHGQGD